MNSKDLVVMFFNELKQYNSRNFKILEHADLNQENSTIFKSCSSVVTRYFIFKEHHPEISESNMKLLYFKLRIDLIARYFSEYPAANIEDLKPFQRELKIFIANNHEVDTDKTT